MFHLFPSFLSRIGTLWIVLGVAIAASVAEPTAPLKSVPFTDVQFQDAFWQPRIETNRTVTLPHNIQQCEKTGRIANFSKAAGHMPGNYEGPFYNDSDVYKVLEGAAYCLAQHPDKELEAKVDQIIDEIAAAQRPDGYINSYFQLTGLDKRWTDLNVKHELYCAGHLFEGAVAYAQATGKTKLLDVACKMADHIGSIFGPGKKLGWPGHPEIELALIKLYHYTGEQRYLDLSKFFLDIRGTFLQEGGGRPQYMQAYKPIREQEQATGHAVRAMYLYSGATDVAALTGDEGFTKAMDAIWNNLVTKKMYVTGSIGSRRDGEAFGEDYELPNDTAYCETCAAIGMALWNQRLMLLHKDGKYADIVEREIYNGILSGVSLGGDKFFYVNPLSSQGLHHRQPFFDTACCPSNVVRFLPSIPGYTYANDDKNIWVNQYVTSTAKIKLASGIVTVAQKTDYPWSGDIIMTLSPTTPTEFDLYVRIPGWSRTPKIEVAGKPLEGFSVERGYVKIRRPWKAGDTVKLRLPMPVERVLAYPNIDANRGKVALQRGPIVYCVEAVDNGGRVSNLKLPIDAELTAQMRPELLNGVVVIQAKGFAMDPTEWAGKLYQPTTGVRPVTITAIPYYAWDHREPGEMLVWLP
ncbi:MAG: glycoside hydrolase family 127 protein [Phycisphaerae bacterium]|nr:glycoside hydrolase family 127 protein [Phycisphaerae bacterium]